MKKANSLCGLKEGIPMKFTKMQGAGNDFIVINNIEEKLPQAQFAALARRLCTRRMSIGADGMMIVDAPQNGGDYRMYFYNADGSLGEMCGNGARCIARYGYEKGLAGETQRVETTAGLVVGQRRDKRMYTVRLNDITKFAQDVIAKIDGKTVQSRTAARGRAAGWRLRDDAGSAARAWTQAAGKQCVSEGRECKLLSGNRRERSGRTDL